MDRKIEVSEKDLDKASAHFASNAILVWPGAEPVKGAPDIKASLAEAFKDDAFALEWRPEKIVVAKTGDLGWTSGHYSLTRTDPASKQKVTVKGPFVETFAKTQDGRWLISSDMMGPTPPPGADP